MILEPGNKGLEISKAETAEISLCQVSHQCHGTRLKISEGI